MAVSSLPGGIDDTAPRRKIPDPQVIYQGITDEGLAEQAAMIQAEISRRAEEARRPKFPITWDEFSLYCTKDDRGTDADNLGLEGDAAHNFAYAGLGLTLRVQIEENGDVTATHIRYPKTDQMVALPIPLKMN